jgi:hypothetical protein
MWLAQFICTPQFFKTPKGLCGRTVDLMGALWRVNIMLVLNRSLLNRECFLINVLKALALIISISSPHVTLLLKITLRYFALFTSGIFHPLYVR